MWLIYLAGAEQSFRHGGIVNFHIQSVKQRIAVPMTRDYMIRHAFNTVARARGMTALARDTGLSREALYKAFGENGDPTLDTLLKVTKALGVRLAVAG